MSLALPLDVAAIARACERSGVKRLRVFGSVLTDDFDPKSSDVDFLVEFLDGRGDYFHDYFDFKIELEQIVGRSVDLVDAVAIKNPHFAKSAFGSALEIFSV